MDEKKKLEKIRKWASSKNGKKSLISATEKAKKANKELDEAIRFDYEKLNKRMTI
jgi:hypothetical protein